MQFIIKHVSKFFNLIHRLISDLAEKPPHNFPKREEEGAVLMSNLNGQNIMLKGGKVGKQPKRSSPRRQEI